MRPKRSNSDCQIDEMIENYRRAGVALILGISLALVWVIATLSQFGAKERAGIVNGFLRVFTIASGWGAVTFVATAAMQYLYAFLFVRIKARS